MEKVIIDENKILEFIDKNDKRNGARLDKYKELIKRLIDEKISLNAIYGFILENDKSIGNRANFYKYINRRFPKSKTEQLQALKTQETKKTTQTITEDRKTATTTPITSKTATQILSQDYDLLSNAE